jgi:hypothetical protein
MTPVPATATLGDGVPLALARLRIELVEFENRVKELQESLHNIEWKLHNNNCQSPLHHEDRLVTRIEEVLARIVDSGSDSERDRRRCTKEGDAAKYIGVSVSILRSWRTKRSKNGSPYTRLGRLVMYPIAELHAHMKARTVPPRGGRQEPHRGAFSRIQ